MSKEIVELLFFVYPDAMSRRDDKGRTPFQCALESVRKYPNAPATIQYLLSRDKTLVNTKCSNDRHPLDFLQRTSRIWDHKDSSKRARYRDSLKYMLEAEPDQDFGFFKVLEGLDPFLQEDVFVHTLDDPNMTTEQKHIQMDIFFTTFRPETFKTVMVRNLLESSKGASNATTCMDWMNKQSKKRSVVCGLMAQLYLQIACMGTSFFWLLARTTLGLIRSLD